MMPGPDQGPADREGYLEQVLEQEVMTCHELRLHITALADESLEPELVTQVQDPIPSQSMVEDKSPLPLRPGYHRGFPTPAGN